MFELFPELPRLKKLEPPMFDMVATISQHLSYRSQTPQEGFQEVVLPLYLLPTTAQSRQWGTNRDSEAGNTARCK